MQCPACRTENSAESKFCRECATPLPQGTGPASLTRTLEAGPLELSRGMLFAGRYEIIEALGAGGMGRVYRAHDTKLNEEVALKLINPEIAADKKTVERFHNEIKVARKIRHKNVCAVYDFHEEGRTLFLTMEYVRGEDLKSLIHRTKTLSVGTSLAIARQIAEGLGEAHKLGVIHRDLKPGNVMIDKDGNAKIMDFGIARVIREKGVTGEGAVIGTPEYMSPEQAEGKEADRRSDIYSLGIILYEMLTGQVPFDGDTPLSIAMKQKLVAPRDPRDLVSDLPDGLSLLILKCLEKNEEKRYRDADELLRELDGIERGTTALEPRVPKTRSPAPTEAAKSKWKIAALLGGIGILLTAAVISKLLIFTGREEVLDSIAVLPFENVNADADTEYLSDGITETLINKLSQLSVFKKVISRASSFAYKGEKIDPKKVGADLGVKTVLTARIVRHGESLSISPALVKAADNSQLWGERYTRRFQDVFAIEEEITSAIITALRLELTGEQKKRISERRIDNVQAYEFYLKAKREIGLWTKDGCDRALQYLEKGLEIIGENAMLNAGIGYVYYSYANLGIGGEENGKKAELFGQKALEMDPESPEAHLVLGLVNSAFFGNQQKGVYHLKKALAASPNDGDIMWWLVLTYAITGKISAAVPIAARMSEVDPLNPQTLPAKGILSLYGGRLDEAFEMTSQAPPPVDPPGVFMYAWFLTYKKRSQEMEKIIGKSIGDPKLNAMWQLCFLLKYAAKGDRENFSRWLSPELLFTVKRDPQYSSLMADIYALLGDRQKSLDWLENAVDRGFYNYPFLNAYDPYLADIRGEPRFQRLMERAKSEWEHFEE